MSGGGGAGSAAGSPSSKQKNRKSVADILDEEFDLLEVDGDTRMNSYKQAGL